MLHQNAAGVLGVAESRDVFGWALTTGDFDGNGRDDIAVGAPGEDVGTLDSAGAVNVLYGAAAGISTASDDLWTQASAGIAGDAEAYDRFGESLTAADFSGNGRDDLAVGAPWDSIAGIAEVGAVNVLYGTASGLGPANDQLWHQNQPSIEGGNEAFDRFGETLSSGDFSGNGRADLGVGVPGESIGGITDIGALNVLYGTAAGLGSANNQLRHQNSAGIVGDGEPYDRMSGRLRSSGTYRIGFEDGTDVRVNGDRLSHSPPDRIDMSGVNGGPDYTIVASRAGTIRALVDSNAEPTDNNNYVWIQHSDGEWSKYTHFATGSAAAGRFLNEPVSAGTVLGIAGRHLTGPGSPTTPKPDRQCRIPHRLQPGSGDLRDPRTDIRCRPDLHRRRLLTSPTGPFGVRAATGGRRSYPEFVGGERASRRQPIGQVCTGSLLCMWSTYSRIISRNASGRSCSSKHRWNVAACHDAPLRPVRQRRSMMPSSRSRSTASTPHSCRPSCAIGSSRRSTSSVAGTSPRPGQ